MKLTDEQIDSIAKTVYSPYFQPSGIHKLARLIEAAVLAAHPPAAPVAYVNYDELDNMLDDRTATIAGVRDGWRKTPLYAHPPAQDTQDDSMTAHEEFGMQSALDKWNAGVAPAQDTQVEIPHGLENALIAECERAMRQRDTFLKSGKSTAGHGRSHDTCFGFILRKFLGKKSERLPAQDLQDAKDAARYDFVCRHGVALFENGHVARVGRNELTAYIDKHIAAKP